MPSPPEEHVHSVRSRAYTRERARVKIIGTLLTLAIACAVLVGVSTVPSHAAPAAPSVPTHAATPTPTIPALGARWFALGTSVPYLRRGCDFGCGSGGGIAGSEARVDRLLRDMSRSGLSVVRWALFPGDAWQVQRDATGAPTTIAPAALRDLDVLLRLAAKHDLYVVPALFPDPDQVPASWFTDPSHRTALATALRPMFQRAAKQRSLLGWELVSDADTLADSGAATIEQLRAHATSLLSALDAGRRVLAVARPLDVSRIDTWVGLGFGAYAPPEYGADDVVRCLTCRSAAAVAAAEGADAPILIGTFATPTVAATTTTLRAAATRGFAGALAESWTGMPGARPRPPAAAVREFAYRTALAGPHSRPRNPCLGPDAGNLRCPNLRMSVPRDVKLGRRNGRAILYSTNSLDSVGAGPASLHGVRNGRLTMRATQLLHRKHGRPISIRTGAKLQFKAIPGQFRYWKWNGAAQMELWRLDSSGAPVELARRGPKTVYCLRDLKRTRGGIARSPRSRVYPACSQNPAQRTVTLGTSVGWSDVYPATYYENWVDVTGLRGCFAYVHIADPTNVIYESNEDDNRSRVVVRLPFNGSSRGCPGAKPLPVSGQNGLGY